MATFYLSTLQMRSASATKWQADTIFGHLCWSILRHEGENVLQKKFLSLYKHDDPPILVSNGFPSGFVVRPPVCRRMSDFSGLPKEDRIRKERDWKKMSSSSWLSLDEFNRFINSEETMPSQQPDTPFRVVRKNTVNRDTGTTSGEAGQLFDFAENHWQSIDIYWRLSEGYESVVRRFLDDLVLTGYGKRKSVGYGQVASYTLAPFGGFNSPKNANGFVSLSNFMPQKNEPAKGFWTTRVKYGKLGEEAASGPNPFKKPLIFFDAGTCFYDSPVKDWYGRLVTDVSPGTPALQYAFAFPIPARLPELDAV